MRSAHWSRVVAFALATSLVIVACGGDDPPAPTPDQVPAVPAPAPPEPPPSPEPEPEPEEPVVDGDPELLWSVETEGRVDRV
ncbi:MAG: hypothetical protein WD152_04315, partial [Nitriliruptoraceae bacterium]